MENSAKITGLLADCNVLTMQGYVPVSKLQAGDRIITRNGMRVLRELKRTSHEFRAVAVGCGTLGFNRPATAMLMAPGQEVMVRDWRAEMLFGRDQVIVPIERMVDGTYIAEADEMAQHDVFELCFDEEEVFYADGVEIISKLTVAQTETLPEAA